MKNISVVAVSVVIAALSAGNSSAAGGDEAFALDALDKSVAVAIPAGVPVAAGNDPASLTKEQYETLISMAKNIRSCPSLKTGTHKPYQMECVDLMVDAASRVYTSFLPDGDRFARAVSEIKKCPVYIFRWDSKQAYEEGCVNEAVSFLVHDLKHLSEAAASSAAGK